MILIYKEQGDFSDFCARKKIEFSETHIYDAVWCVDYVGEIKNLKEETRFGAREHFRGQKGQIGPFIVEHLQTSRDVIGRIFLCENVDDISVGVLVHVW